MRFPIALFVGLAAVYSPVACKSSTDVDHETTDGVVYGDETTDEGLSAFEAASSTTDATKAPALTAPAAGAKVPAATPVAFAWKATPTGLLFQKRAPGRYEGSSPFGPIRAAHAHGDPMNGKAYLLTLKGGGSTIVRVFTKATTYTPDADAWTKLKTAKSIEATLASASFDNNNIVQGSGPFVAPPVSFTVE